MSEIAKYHCPYCKHRYDTTNYCDSCREIIDCSLANGDLKRMSKYEPDEIALSKIAARTCFNCGNNGGDKTDHSENNPCTTCDVPHSFGNVDLVPEGKRINWVPQSEDLVNHPSHYQTKSGLETIQVIEAFTDGLEGIEAVCTANVIKYICRWKKKNGLQDLKKAQWYLNKLIEKEEKEKNNE